MRRRGKRTVNNSESTGKVGQELPQIDGSAPAPLRPSYPDEMPPAPQASEHDAPESEEPSNEHSAPAHEDHGEAAERTGRRRRRRRRRGGARDNNGVDVGTVQASTPAMPEAVDEDDDADAEAPEQASPEADAPAPAEAMPPAPRSPRGFVVLAIGLPGSGKTTWFKRRSVQPLSSDMLRTILFDDITEQRYQGLVFSTLRSLLRARLVAKMPWNYVDATNLSPHERRQWIKMARSFGYEVQAVFFDVPVEICLARNQKRERRVSDEIIRTMAERLRPPNFKEGFSKITVVRVRPKDGQALPEEPVHEHESGDADEAEES